ncbi:MAG: hypothetical protein HQL64_15975 [Magnetococcales bacterium]|nr:hypothetical protein [Magnetococcales bacterium]
MTDVLTALQMLRGDQMSSPLPGQYPGNSPASVDLPGNSGQEWAAPRPTAMETPFASTVFDPSTMGGRAQEYLIPPDSYRQENSPSAFDPDRITAQTMELRRFPQSGQDLPPLYPDYRQGNPPSAFDPDRVTAQTMELRRPPQSGQDLPPLYPDYRQGNPPSVFDPNQRITAQTMELRRPLQSRQAMPHPFHDESEEGFRFTPGSGLRQNGGIGDEIRGGLPFRSNQGGIPGFTGTDPDTNGGYLDPWSHGVGRGRGVADDGLQVADNRAKAPVVSDVPGASLPRRSGPAGGVPGQEPGTRPPPTGGVPGQSRTPGSVGVPQAAPNDRNATIPVDAKLGDLSEMFEAGKDGSKAFTIDDKGIKYYGKYQIKADDTMPGFMAFAESNYPELYKELKSAGGAKGAEAGSAVFKSKWMELAGKEEFGRLERDFAEKNKYEPYIEKVKKATGFDVTTRSRALQQVMWSTAIQHGGRIGVVVEALGGLDHSKASDAELLEALY